MNMYLALLPSLGLLAVIALFGRSAELARLRGWLVEAVKGLPQVVVCSGEAGIGKTRLLEALSDEAESGGAQVLWARSLAPASAPPYWLWRQLFGTDVVTGPVPVTGSVPVGTVPEGDRAALFERLAGRLIEAAAAGGAVMVVDDIHWADEPSLVALMHMVRTLHRAKLLVCVAERSGGPDSSDGWRGARSSLIREPHAHLLELHGLSRAGSAELLRELLGRSMPEPVVSQAHAICAGNPFYLREVARALDRVVGSDVELPATLAGGRRAAPRTADAAHAGAAARLIDPG